jgi:hypothetical protein
MGDLTSLRVKRVTLTADELLELAADVHSSIPLLRGAAKRMVNTDDPLFSYVNGFYDELEGYINNSSWYFEKAQDANAGTSIVGDLSYNELKRRRDNCDRRMKEIEATGNITQLGRSR